MSILSSSTRTFLAFGLVALFVQSAFAHTYLSTVVLGGTQLAEGDCVRAHPASGYDDPITLVSSPNMTCGFLPESAEPANRKCPIAAGSQIGIIWHHNNDLAGDDIIDPSHKGPVIFYLAKSDSGAGDVWFKIYQDGYNAATGAWATDRLIANNGLVTVTIPSDIVAGNYLLRGEIFALHQAYELDGVQPYVGCVELTISGSGNSNPSASGVAFPGYYVDTDAGLLFNVYGTFTSYPIPGPALYVSGSSSPSTAAPTSRPTSAPVTAAPTQHATAAPTTAPAAPTTAPAAPTTAPAAPTNAPSSGNGISLQLNGGSGTWWLGVIVTGGSETTVKVEITDSGAVSSWFSLSDQSYAYVYSQSVQLTLPISVRLTSSTGKQVVLTNVFSSWAATGVINTGKNYGSAASTTAPTAAPTQHATAAPTPTQHSTAAPTPTQHATAAPSGVSVMVYPSANQWWFALTVNGVDASSISSVMIKDAGAYGSFLPMTSNSWGYSFNTQGSALTAPITVQITSTSGTTTAIITDITPRAVFSASSL